MTVHGDRPLSRREMRDRARGGSGVQLDADTEADTDGERATPDAAAPVPPDASGIDPDTASEPAPSSSAEPERWFPPEQEPGSRPEGESPADGWNRPLPSDLAAPERTMTRRELRILRERAEAAGQPAPDVVFLPSGETTVTGMIPVVGPGASASPTLAPEADAAGVVTEQPVEAEPPVEPVASLPADQPAIPALIEPLPSSGVRFSTDAGRADATAVPEVGTEPAESGAADGAEDAVLVAVAEADDPSTGEEPAEDSDPHAPEIVLDAEPVTGPVDSEAARTHGDAAEDQATATVDEIVTVPAEPVEPTAPGPSTLRPFDASFRRSGRRAEAVAAANDDAGIDNSAAPLATDAEGVRGDILAAPDSAARTPAHWSDGADDTDTEAPTALTRDVGVTTGAVTTHALVLPTIPDVGDPLLSPLTSTGEIMVTGTIDLPRSFGSTGAHPALFDHPEVDALLDESDREDADSAAAPVRASRAVSSTTTTRAMIDADDGRRSRLLPIVLISSLVVGVAAAAFLAAAFIFRVI